MFCSQCGTQLDATAKFCSGCGSAATADPTPPGAYEESAPNYWRFLFIGLAAGALILLAGGTWLFFDGKLKHGSTPAEQPSASVAANTEPTAAEDAAVAVEDLSPKELQAERTALDQAISRAEQRAGHPVQTALEK